MSKVGWFEIPVKNLDRAIKFYEAVFQINITKADMGPLKMGWFPEENEKAGATGSLVYHEDFYRPDDLKGTLIYFTCDDASNELARIVEAGGKVIVEKRQISPDVGYMAVFLDSEGNRIALHSKA